MSRIIGERCGQVDEECIWESPRLVEVAIENQRVVAAGSLSAKLVERVSQSAEVVDKEIHQVPEGMALAVGTPPRKQHFSVLKNSRPVIVMGPLNCVSL